MPTEWLPPETRSIAGPHPLPAAGTLHVWCWSEELEGSSEWLDSSERHRWEQLVTPTLQRRYLAAHAGLRSLLAGYLGTSPAELAFDQLSLGKPFLARGEHSEGGPPLCFNLAHSGGMNIVAVSCDEVGIDIEQVRPVVSLDRLAQRHMTAKEQLALEGLSGAEQLAKFYHLWTRKEACVKLVGIGLQGALDGAEVQAGDEWHGMVGLPPSWNPRWSECWVSQISAPAGYIAAVATPQPPREVARFLGV